MIRLAAACLGLLCAACASQSRVSPGAALALGAGAAVGGLAGDKLGGGAGAIAGGAVGLAGAALIHNALLPSSEAEAAEQARREERTRILGQYWRAQSGAEPGGGAPASPPPLLDYPAGIYSGIAFGPRRAADPSLGEPAR